MRFLFILFNGLESFGDKKEAYFRVSNGTGISGLLRMLLNKLPLALVHDMNIKMLNFSRDLKGSFYVTSVLINAEFA